MNPPMKSAEDGSECLMCGVTVPQGERYCGPSCEHEDQFLDKEVEKCLGSAGNGEATFAVSVEFRPFGAGIFKALGVYRPMTLVLCSAKSAGVIGLSDQFKTGPFVVRPVARFSTRKFGARIA